MFSDAGGGALFFGDAAVAMSAVSVSAAAICLARRFESTAATSDRVVGDEDSGDGVAEDSTPSNELDCCMVSTFLLVAFVTWLVELALLAVIFALIWSKLNGFDDVVNVDKRDDTDSDTGSVATLAHTSFCVASEVPVLAAATASLACLSSTCDDCRLIVDDDDDDDAAADSK